MELMQRWRRMEVAHVLSGRIPAESMDYVIDLLAVHPVHVLVSRPRRTRLGFYRSPGRGQVWHHISVNEDLNPYAFLVTLLHEIAHLHVQLHVAPTRRRRVAPHGREWKCAFGQLLEPVVREHGLPSDVTAAIEGMLDNPRASSCADATLLEVLSRYDPDADSVQRLDDLPQGSLFRLTSGRVFRHKQRLRTWHLCEEVGTRKRFRVRGSSRVEIVAAADLPASKR